VFPSGDNARLVDYFVDNGTNARVWVQLTPEAASVVVPAKTQILSRLNQRTDVRIAPASSALDEALRQHPIAFETRHDMTLFAIHDAIPFYTWSDRECCLPKGATSATLAGHFPDLADDAVLVFEEQRGPLTGEEEDADRTRRWALRLTSVITFNAASEPLTDPLTGTQITRIEWMAEDALPFPFCLSGFTDEEHGARYRDDLSIARGNIVLADHGLTLASESLGEVPEPQILLPPDPSADRCHRPSPQFARPRFRPSLQSRPVTQWSTYDPTLPASVSLVVDPEGALPDISLAGHPRSRQCDLVTATRLVRQRTGSTRVRARSRKRRCGFSSLWR
jgi:hypothetical protein